MSKSIA